MTSRIILVMLLLGTSVAYGQVIGSGGAQSDVAPKATRRPGPVLLPKHSDAPPSPKVKHTRRPDGAGSAPSENRTQPTKAHAQTVTKGR